jgi:hypothetical protein
MCIRDRCELLYRYSGCIILLLRNIISHYIGFEVGGLFSARKKKSG